MHVLIVEDHEPLAAFFRAALATRGIESRCVLSGEAACAAIAARCPSLILTDLNLPGESGLVFVQRLKADPGLAGIPVVAITADDLQWSRDDLLDAGCADHLLKPVLLKRLLEVVGRYFPVSP
jgi:CheY-like chemotaxis protein